jgi:hypothetical protein
MPKDAPNKLADDNETAAALLKIAEELRRANEIEIAKRLHSNNDDFYYYLRSEKVIDESNKKEKH